MKNQPLTVMLDQYYLYLLDAIVHYHQRKNRSECLRELIESNAMFLDDEEVLKMIRARPKKQVVKDRKYKSGFRPAKKKIEPEKTEPEKPVESEKPVDPFTFDDDEFDLDEINSELNSSEDDVFELPE